MTRERWLPVVDWGDRYEISDLGRIRSVLTGAILKPFKTQPAKTDHLSIYLHRNGNKKLRTIHTLVLEAFVGPRPPGLYGCHQNDIGDDNRPENLRWDTQSSNIRDSVRNGTHGQSRKTHCLHGHPYTKENTLIRPPNGWRSCRTCKRQSTQQWRDRQKVEVQ